MDKRVKKIDSLIYMGNNLVQAEKEADNLYQWLLKNDNKGQYKKALLDVMLFKSHLKFTLNRGADKALEISLEVIDKAKEFGLPEQEYRACLTIAIMYESSDEFDLCRKYLNRANEIAKEHQLEKIYSIYCVRMSSYYRLIKEKDSATYFAYKGLDFATKYKNDRELTDVYLLLGMLLDKNNEQEAVKFTKLSIDGFQKRNDYVSIAYQYNNIALIYLNNKKFEKALSYNDSAFSISKKYSFDKEEISYFMKQRSQIYDSLKNIDSAYYYFKQYHNNNIDALWQKEQTNVKRITEKYENNKKEAIIKSKNSLLFFLGSVLVLIAIGSILLTRKNHKINSQNKVISTQVVDLSKNLEQKQVLLSELQHRVKNNLQHVISIFEIQKESITFNNIEEIIRENQNRIHSMVLLHEKLNVFENVREVSLNSYLTELSVLVKSSYDNDKYKIRLNVACEIEKFSIERALPLGFIIVELVSNSMKHAFENKEEGFINILITKEEETQNNKLLYNDNGKGFDFSLNKGNGLGLEIIKGLIDQLDGNIVTDKSNGFELIIYFK